MSLRYKLVFRVPKAPAAYLEAQVFVDTVGSPQSYQDKLNRVFGGKPSFTVEKKADSKFPVVSAASICAKVTRDKEMDNWRFEEPGFRSCGQLGSGYPGGAH